MNRVVLCGRLADRPRLAYTTAGVPVATLRLQVARDDPNGTGGKATDDIDCVAFREIADTLAQWGEGGDQINLEGRLRRDTWRDATNRRQHGLRVHVDQAYFADPRLQQARAELKRSPVRPPEGTPETA